MIIRELYKWKCFNGDECTKPEETGRALYPDTHTWGSDLPGGNVTEAETGGHIGKVKEGAAGMKIDSGLLRN